MPFVNIPKLILETYNFWNIDRTFYEYWPLDDFVYVYLFACHYGHTDVRMKVDWWELLKL